MAALLNAIVSSIQRISRLHSDIYGTYTIIKVKPDCLNSQTDTSYFVEEVLFRPYKETPGHFSVWSDVHSVDSFYGFSYVSTQVLVIKERKWLRLSSRRGHYLNSQGEANIPSNKSFIWPVYSVKCEFIIWVSGVHPFVIRDGKHYLPQISILFSFYSL